MSTICGAVVVQRPIQKIATYPELFEFEGQAVINRVLHEVESVVDELIILTFEGYEVERLKAALTSDFLGCEIDQVQNEGWDAASLVKAALGRKGVEITVVVPASVPLISADLLVLLLQLIDERDAVLLRDVKGRIDILTAAYRNGSCANAFVALAKEKAILHEVPESIRRSIVLNPDAIKALDPHLGCFLKVRSRSDLALAKRLLALRGAS